jgi:hypothetical protein
MNFAQKISNYFVTPAKAEAQLNFQKESWLPAFAGMTWEKWRD